MREEGKKKRGREAEIEGGTKSGEEEGRGKNYRNSLYKTNVGDINFFY